MQSLPKPKQRLRGRLPPMSVNTFRNYLKEHGLRSRKAKAYPFINAFQRTRRLHWAQELSRKPQHFWRNVVYSDETRILLFQNYGRVKVSCAKGQRNNPRHVQPTIKHGLSLTVWGCMSYNGVGRLRILDQNERMNSAWYIKVLEDEVVPSLAGLYPQRRPFF